MGRDAIEWHHVRSTGNKSRRRTPTQKQRVRSTIYNLTFDIRALQQEIQDLTRLRSLLYSRALLTRYDGDGSLVRKAKEFMEVVKYGYVIHNARTRDCIVAVLDENVAFWGLSGRDQLVRFAHEFDAQFECVEFQLVSLLVVGHDQTTGSCVIRVDGFNYLTPRRLHADGEKKKPRVVPTSLHLYFDARGCVVRNDVVLDEHGEQEPISTETLDANESVVTDTDETEEPAASVASKPGSEDDASAPAVDKRMSLRFMLAD